MNAVYYNWDFILAVWAITSICFNIVLTKVIAETEEDADIDTRQVWQGKKHERSGDQIRWKQANIAQETTRQGRAK